MLRSRSYVYMSWVRKISSSMYNCTTVDYKYNDFTHVLRYRSDLCDENELRKYFLRERFYFELEVVF